MATDLNQVSLVGRLTRDAELKYTTYGTALAKFSIANGYQIKRQDNWEDAVSFFNCVLWGKRAEALQQYLTKGKQVGITGQLRQERWEQDGQSRSKDVIHISSLQLLGGKKEENQRATEQTEDSLPMAEKFEDDIPF